MKFSDFDELAIKQKFGTTITKVSMYEFSNIIKSITDEEIDKDMEVQKRYLISMIRMYRNQGAYPRFTWQLKKWQRKEI
ncbi:MAG: hypothetical protein U5N58_09775 [Actinomycetota bacterium]|nr:hypothetical protein [Actinomycetota bacterium]